MRERPRQRGFSFVELLVTIVLAGIFFAALVPVFVGALRTSSKDNLRNIAVNIAQGKIEKIRGLQYDQIRADDEHLYSTTFASQQFGSEFEHTSASGTKKYWIFYDTSIYPANADEGKEDYKQVQVWVSWAPAPPADRTKLASPNPAISAPERAKLTSANSVTLRTLIYKQYAGPGIVGPPRITSPVLVGKETIDSPPRTLYCVTAPSMTALSMTIVIDVDPDQVSSTVGVNVGIYSATGEVIKQLSDADDSTTDTPQATSLVNNQWRVTWTAPASVGDGAYVITAAAVSDTGHIGNTASTDFRLELGPPDPVVLTATPGNKAVQLEWTLSDRDIDHFEIYRSLTSVFSSTPIQSDWQTASYTDPASDPLALPLVNLQGYYYKVIAVDIFGQPSPAPTSISPVIPVPGDETPPNSPSNLLWSASGKIITLLWTASSGDVNIGSTVSGLGDYYVYRSSNGSPPWQEIWHGPGVTHSVGHLEYLQTMYYKVTAKDKSLNESGPTNTVAAKSEAAPHFDLHVQNQSGNRYVRVHSESLTGPVVGAVTGWFNVNNNTTNVTNWSGLVIGTYFVEWGSNATGGGNSGSGSFTQLSSDPYTFPLQ